MKIRFISSDGVHLGDISIYKVVLTVSWLLTTIVFAFAYRENISEIVSKSAFFTGEGKWTWNEIATYFVQALSVSVGVIGFWLAWRRVLSGLWAWFVRSYWRSKFQLLRLVLSKLKAETISYPNTNDSNFRLELLRASNDEKLLMHATMKGLIENRSIWSSNWSNADLSRPEMPAMTNIPTSDTRARDSLAQNIEILSQLVEQYRALEQQDSALVFFCSSVQPAIIRGASIILERTKADHVIDFKSDMITGPDAVQAARSEKQSNNNKVVLVAAPLSAFCTLETAEQDTPPNDLFQPLAVLLREKQELLFVEGPTTNIARRNTLFYYDNSTAEECVAQIRDVLNYFAVEQISSFPEYKNLLKGTSRIRLQPGDAIVSWSPLTEYYAERNIPNQELPLRFVRGRILGQNSNLEGFSHGLSRIVLYGDKICFEDNAKLATKIAWRFSLCLRDVMLSMKKQQKTWNRPMDAWVTSWRLYREYRRLYEEMIK